MSVITFENFWDEVKFFCHGQVKKADGLGCIVSKIDSPEAQAWIEYAERKGWPQRAKFIEKMLKSGNALTMPCADPRKFDPEYKGGEGRKERRPEPQSERRADARSIADKVREAAKNTRPPNERRRKDWEAEPARVETPAEYLARAKANPEAPGFSPTLRAHLGIKDEEAAK